MLTQDNIGRIGLVLGIILFFIVLYTPLEPTIYGNLQILPNPTADAIDAIIKPLYELQLSLPNDNA